MAVSYTYTKTIAGLSENDPMFEFQISNEGVDNDGQLIQYRRSYVWSDWNKFSSSGAPAPEKKQKPSDVLQQQTDSNTGQKDTSRITFDKRLAKPRNGNPFGDVAFAFDPNDIRATREGHAINKDKKDKIDPEDDTSAGVPSIHNWYAYTTLSGAGTTAQGKSLFFDIEGERRWYENDDLVLNISDDLLKGSSKNPTTTKLVQYGTLDKRGRTPYYYSDFAYCKYWKKIENNRLITLRRYAVPTFGSLEFPDWDPNVSSGKLTPKENKFMPIAQAVTWMGSETGNTMESLMNFSVGLNWQEFKATEDDNDEQMKDATTLPLIGKFMKTMLTVSGQTSNNAILHDGQAPIDPYQEGPYVNRIKGPVNRVDATKGRAPGFKFDHKISLKFHYNARSVGAINTKAAMLDIIANFLLLTYGNGAFWGGYNRFRGSIQAYPWHAGMAAWYAGDPIAFGNALKTTIQSTMQGIAATVAKLLKNPVDALQGIFKTGMMMALQKSGHNQLFHGYRALLTGEPVGEWHLVVGNPLNPMMMIGNLICTDCSFKFGEELGPDDFPTELEVTVELEHGMVLDRSGVESMFNRGRGRIYTLPSGVENTSAANESKVDPYTGKKNPYINRVMGFNTGGATGAVGSKPSWALTGEQYEKWSAQSGKEFMNSADTSINMIKNSELGYSTAKTPKK